MIVMRLWLILSVSAAAPFNSNWNKEAAVSDEIVNGDDMAADGLHSHSSPNTGRDGRFVMNGGIINIETIESISFSMDPATTTDEITTAATTSAVNTEETTTAASTTEVCTANTITPIDSCICKSANGKQEQTCKQNEGCTQNGTCIPSCLRDGEIGTSDCICENPWEDKRELCTEGQLCQIGICLRDPEPCKAVQCVSGFAKKYCPIKCDPDKYKPDFCSMVDCNMEGSKEFCPFECEKECKKDALLEARCVCKYNEEQQGLCRSGNRCLANGCNCLKSDNCDIGNFLFILFFG